MTLVEIRQKLIELSGRYELVVDTTDWADAGADFFIQAGQDYLDRLRKIPKADNSIFEELASGEWYLTFSRCRSIKEVWVNNTEGRSQLTKKDMSWLYREYSALISATDSGTPLYYCPAKMRSTEKTDQTSLGTFFNYAVADSEDIRGIMILGPPDESIVVEVKGLFYSDLLSIDADESYWTINWPSTLIKAALRELEIFNRNSEGVRDWTSAILSDVDGLTMDVVEEEVTDITQIGG